MSTFEIVVIALLLDGIAELTGIRMHLTTNYRLHTVIINAVYAFTSVGLYIWAALRLFGVI